MSPVVRKYTVAAPRSILNCYGRPNVADPLLLKRRIHATKMLLSIVKKLKKLTGLNGFTCARIINCVMIAPNARRLKHSLNKDKIFSSFIHSLLFLYIIRISLYMLNK